MDIEFSDYKYPTASASQRDTVNRHLSDSAISFSQITAGAAGQDQSLRPTILRRKTLQVSETSALEVTGSSWTSESQVHSGMVESSDREELEHHGASHTESAPIRPNTNLESRPVTQASLQSTELSRDLMEAHINCYRLIDQVLQSRTRLDFEKQKVWSGRRFVSESLEDANQVLTLAMTHGTVEESLKRLSECQRALREDWAALQAQENAVKDLQTELSNLEFRLVTQEKQLVDRMRDHFAVLDVDIGDLQHGHSSAPEPRPASSHTPSLLERYYDRQGDVNIQLERLEELDIDYREEMEGRDMCADRGEPVWPSDEEFAGSYNQRRQTILDDLHAAQKDTDRLAQECNEAGLEIAPGSDLGAGSVESTQDARPTSPNAELAGSPNLPTTLDLDRYPGPSALAVPTHSLVSATVSSRRVSGDDQERQCSVHNWLEDVAINNEQPQASEELLQAGDPEILGQLPISSLLVPASIRPVERSKRRRSAPPAASPSAWSILSAPIIDSSEPEIQQEIDRV